MNVNQLELYVNKTLISREVGTVGTLTTDISSTNARIYEYNILAGSTLAIRTLGAITVSLNMFDTSGNLLLPQTTSTGRNYTVIPGHTYFLLIDSNDEGKFSLYVNGVLDTSKKELWIDPSIINSLPLSFWDSAVTNKTLNAYESATIGTVTSIIKNDQINVFEVNILSGSMIHINTLGGLDTKLQLLDSTGKLLIENDDATISTYDSSGQPITLTEGKFSRIDYSVTADNKYYVILQAASAGTTSITFTGVQLKPDYVTTSNTATNSGSSSNSNNNNATQSTIHSPSSSNILSITRGKATRNGFTPKDEILLIQSINSAMVHCKSKNNVSFILNNNTVRAKHPVTNILYELPASLLTSTDIMVDFSGYIAEFSNNLSTAEINIQYMTLDQGK